MTSSYTFFHFFWGKNDVPQGMKGQTTNVDWLRKEEKDYGKEFLIKNGDLIEWYNIWNKYKIMWIANYARENKGKLLPPRRPNSYMNLSGLPCATGFLPQDFWC